jgi:Flp pilus assembly pilin Flp
MKKLCTKLLANYWADEKGLVTVEWVGITGVALIAAILISAAILDSADGFAGAVIGQLDSAAKSVSE